MHVSKTVAAFLADSETMNTQTYTHRHRQTQTHADTDTDRHRQTRTQTDTHRHMQTQTQTQTHRHTHTHITAATLFPPPTTRQGKERGKGAHVVWITAKDFDVFLNPLQGCALVLCAWWW